MVLAIVLTIWATLKTSADDDDDDDDGQRGNGQGMKRKGSSGGSGGRACPHVGGLAIDI